MARGRIGRRGHSHTPPSYAVAIKRAPIPANAADVKVDEAALSGSPAYPSELAPVMSAPEFAATIGAVFAGAQARRNKWMCRQGLLFFLPALATFIAGVVILATNPIDRFGVTGHDVSLFPIGMVLAVGVTMMLIMFACVCRQVRGVSATMGFVKTGVAALAARGELASRGLQVSFVTEAVQSIMLRPSRGTVFTTAGSIFVIRISAMDRALRAPMTALSHGTVPALSPDGIPTGPGGSIASAFGPVSVPADCIPTEGCGFVLVSPTDYSSPVNSPAATLLSAANNPNAAAMLASMQSAVAAMGAGSGMGMGGGIAMTVMPAPQVAGGSAPAYSGGGPAAFAPPYGGATPAALAPQYGGAAPLLAPSYAGYGYGAAAAAGAGPVGFAPPYGAAGGAGGAGSMPASAPQALSMDPVPEPPAAGPMDLKGSSGETAGALRPAPAPYGL